jgi:YHS domain-containing protein
MLLGMFPAITVNASGTGVLACVIDPADPGSVVVQLQAAGGIGTDDGQLYLFAVPTYVDSIAEQAPVAATAYTGGGNYSFRVPLGDGTAASLLYSKFYVGVRAGGVFTAITGGNFITNPEQIASSALPRTQVSSKKGLHISPTVPTDQEELNLSHGYYTLILSDLISNTPTDYSYTYNGKTYYFTALIAEYDYLISNMSRNGMAITMSLLNDYSPEHPYLLHPGVTFREGTTFYAVNTSTQEGLDVFAATAHFLAERYSGQNAAYGKVDNWILGNEVNDGKLYYYMGEQNIDTFVQEYLQSFRVMYNAVKSAYANANVYICLEHCWGTTDTNLDYGGKNFIDKFNAYATAQGNIDWGLSYHPYSFPLNDADILNDGTASTNFDGTPIRAGFVTNQPSSPIITMKNLQVLTDYFHNSSLLSPSGQVRSIILGEQGYTSYSNITGQNEARQAANIALSYYIAEMNPDVDAFLLRGHCDSWEGSEFFKFGLWNADAAGMPATPKKAYEMYRYLDTAESLQYSAFAKDALNITDWSQVVPGWDAGKFASMGTFTEAPLYTVSTIAKTIQGDRMTAPAKKMPSCIYHP